MTHNQIDFWRLQEEGRHNRAMEQYNQQVADETSRHNIVAEAETTRSNQANESIRAEANVINDAHFQRQDALQNAHYIRSDQETLRHNWANEVQAQDELAESSRHSAVMEKYEQLKTLNTIVHSSVQDTLWQLQGQASIMQAEAAGGQASSRQVESAVRAGELVSKILGVIK